MCLEQLDAKKYSSRVAILGHSVYTLWARSPPQAHVQPEANLTFAGLVLEQDQVSKAVTRRLSRHLQKLASHIVIWQKPPSDWNTQDLGRRPANTIERFNSRKKDIQRGMKRETHTAAPPSDVVSALAPLAVLGAQGLPGAGRNDRTFSGTGCFRTAFYILLMSSLCA